MDLIRSAERTRTCSSRPGSLQNFLLLCVLRRNMPAWVLQLHQGVESLSLKIVIIVINS